VNIVSRPRRPRRAGRACIAIAVLALGMPDPRAGPVVKLTDGRELAGVDLRREGDVYLLVIENGAVIPIPTAVVREVSWVEKGQSPGAAPVRPDAAARVGDRSARGDRSTATSGGAGGEPGGLEAGGRAGRSADDPGAPGAPPDGTPQPHPTVLVQPGTGSSGGSGGAGDNGDPDGWTKDHPDVRVAKPRNLAGGNVPPPPPNTQLAVFGKPSEFARDVVQFDNQPSYWVMDPDEANFNPSTFQKPLRDPNWRPTPAWDPSEDVLEDGRTKWREPPRDSSWRPTDGFNKAGPSDD